jgi:hypothetical protein
MAMLEARDWAKYGMGGRTLDNLLDIPSAARPLSAR